MTASWLERLNRAGESASGLDPAARTLRAAVHRALPDSARSVLHGEPIGHPLHPILVTVPIGAWACASIFDLAKPKGSQKAAQALVGIGVLASLPTALAGATDWSETRGPASRIGLMHAGLNSVALACYASSWLARKRGAKAKGVRLALAGAAALSASGYLGGHLSYRLGVGVTRPSSATPLEPKPH